MIEVGSLCMKIAGREAGKMCVVVDVLDNKFVLVDGQVRRKKCNINHIESVNKKVEIEKGASHEDVVSALKKEGIEVVERKPKAKAPKAVKVEEPKKEKAKKEEKPKAKKVKKA
jgi:large subunit ribosomal protein L14e